MIPLIHRVRPGAENSSRQRPLGCMPGGDHIGARTNASADEMKQWPHAGVFLNADGPWDGEELVRWQDNCRAADMVMEAVHMDSAYIIMKEGPQRER